MMQFLRKIRLELVIGNKVRKYLLFAIGEIMLIMVGILLAVQVSEWNQAKKDRIEERLILSRLTSELIINSEKLSSLLKSFEMKEKAMEQVSLAFHGRPVEIDSIFLTDVIRSSLYGWTVQPLQRLIYDEINNTGRLVIVRNIELRNTITKLYNLIHVMEGVTLSRTSDYARIVYAIVPRENESHLKQDLSSNEQEALVYAVMNSNLDQLIIFEQNRARFLIQVWNSLIKSIAQVNDKIEAELNE